uniref:UNC93-like protein MFSD11 n=1 Tax=Clastoptera arizonana TaxID=38151 RepID=A0A1B6CHF6_9HEMI
MIFKDMDRKLLNIIFLGIYLMILFSAEFAVLNMQKTIISSIHDEKPDFKVEGYSVTGIAYTVFSITVWLAPSLISILGPQLPMVIATIGYICYLLAFSVEEAWAMYMAAVVVGISEALLWTSQGNYLVLNSEPSTLDRNIGIFWILFSSAELYGNLFIYFKMEGKKYIDGDTRKFVVYVMSAVAASSLFMFCLLGKPNNTSLNKETMKKEGPVQALKLTWSIFTTKNMMLLCITFAFIGVQQAFRCGIYSASVGFTLQFGDKAKQLVVLSGLFLGAGEFIGGLYQITLSGFTKKYKYGQSFVIGTGLVCQLISYFLIYLNLPDSSVFGNTMDKAIIQSSSNIAVTCSLMLGFADCCCHTQMYSIMAIMFPENSAQTCAIYKFTKGMFVAFTFYSSSHLGLHTQLAILVPLSLIGNITYNIVLRNVKNNLKKNDNSIEMRKNSVTTSEPCKELKEI